jgi:hypothetical protein
MHAALLGHAEQELQVAQLDVAADVGGAVAGMTGYGSLLARYRHRTGIRI